MRFKAKLTTEKVDYFHSLLVPMIRLCDASNPSRSILYLNPTHVRIPLKHEQDGISCFAEVSAASLFVESRIESQADNAVVMKMDLMHLKMALQSVLAYNRNNAMANRPGNDGASTLGTSAGSVAIRSAMAAAAARSSIVSLKLAKRNGVPCLCLDGTVASFVDVHQAIPVRILRVSEVQAYMPPQLQTPQLQLQVPTTLPLKSVIDKMKHMGKFVYIDGTMKGDLTIRLEHEGASVRCFYNELVPHVDDDSDGSTVVNLNASCTVKVDSAKLANCLQWQATPSSNIVSSCVLAMIEQEMLILHIFLSPLHMGFYTYYIPVQFIRPDEDLG